jgi:hypothetical protein
MKLNRPLINPLPEDYTEPSMPDGRQAAFSHQPSEEEEFSYEAYRSEDQIGLDIDDSGTRVQQFFVGTKALIKERTKYFEISGLWKDPSLPFTVVSMVFVTLILFIAGIIKFGEIPIQVPFIYNYSEATWDQADKSIIFIFPILLLVLESAIVYFIMKLMTFDRRLAIISSTIMTILNLLLLIALSQIYFLIT